MYKYIDNNNRFIKASPINCVFNVSFGVRDLLNKTGFVKLYISEDGYFLKIKPCQPDDLNRNRLGCCGRNSDSLYFSSCELQGLLDDGYDHRIYAYGRDKHDGIIFRIYDTDIEPTKFLLIEKETKMFVSYDGGTRFRLSSELIRVLKHPKRINLHHLKKNGRVYISKATVSEGSYNIYFAKTSENSGHYSLSILNFAEYIGASKRDKFEVRNDSRGLYIYLNGGNLPKNSKGLKI